MKSKLTISFFVVGVLLILSALFLPLDQILFSPKKDLAQIIEIDGSAEVWSLDQIDTMIASKDLMLKHFDVVKTANQSEVQLVILSTNTEIILKPSSEILIESLNETSVVITLRQGDIDLVDFGEAKNNLWIKKEGKLYTIVDFALSFNKNNTQLLTHTMNSTDSSAKLTQAQIEEALNQRKNDFFKCYSQLIQKNEQAHGQVLLNFEIAPQGKIITVQVSKTDIQDPIFLSCLKEVVSRVRFQPFSGENITSFFPLKFE